MVKSIKNPKNTFTSHYKDVELPDYDVFPTLTSMMLHQFEKYNDKPAYIDFESAFCLFALLFQFKKEKNVAIKIGVALC